MLVLGVESSCDETAVALVRDGREVLASVIASQTAAHAPFGGVVPEVAAREHLRVIDALRAEALARAGLGAAEVDAIAVTRGPGLIGALLVGIAYAKGLALGLGKPLIPVDHVHAHVHGALLGLDASVTIADLWPCLALVVSGGHTNLYYMEGPTAFRLVASSVDDACGECFDKVAKLMGLPYPGGPHIERLARCADPGKVPMPRMIERKSQLAFSYSGLKTHLANLLRAEPKPVPEERLADVCAAFQEEALGQIIRKIAIAHGRFPQARSLLVAGGVAANQRFRALTAAELRLRAHFPPLDYCSDNAAMIAAYGYHLWQERGPAAFAALDWDAYSRYSYAEVTAVDG